MKEIDKRIIEYLSAAQVPSRVEDIVVGCGVDNWNTALKHCLVLLSSKQIEGQRSSNGWTFWIAKHSPQMEVSA